MRDPIAALCEVLREAGVRPYWNTAYLSHEGRVVAFRKRAAAWLTGRRAPYRHFDPAPVAPHQEGTT